MKHIDAPMNECPACLATETKRDDTVPPKHTEEPWERQARREADQLSTAELKLIRSAINLAATISEGEVISALMGPVAVDALRTMSDASLAARTLRVLMRKVQRLADAESTMVRLPF